MSVLAQHNLDQRLRMLIKVHASNSTGTDHHCRPYHRVAGASSVHLDQKLRMFFLQDARLEQHGKWSPPPPVSPNTYKAYGPYTLKSLSRDVQLCKTTRHNTYASSSAPGRLQSSSSTFASSSLAAEVLCKAQPLSALHQCRFPPLLPSTRALRPPPR